MSSKEVTNLRKSGKLKEAYDMAKAELKAEENQWTRSAMFWVLKDMFKVDIEKGDKDACREYLEEMKALYPGMNDNGDYAKNAITSASKQLCPNSGLVDEAGQLAKEGKEEDAYKTVMEVHTKTPIEPILHEQVGWIIFRYLKKDFEQIGSVEARHALLNYMKLNNPRPSMVHSQMLNLASKIAEKYSDFRFLPFLKMWGVENFTDDDLAPGQVNGKEIQPLYIRIFRRCLSQGYSLNDCVGAFCENPRISKDTLVETYCQTESYEIYRLSKESASEALKAIEKYAKETQGHVRPNESHSTIMRSLTYLSKDNISPETKGICEALGLDSFTQNDWERKKTEKGDEYPSLVEQYIKTYNESLSAATDKTPQEAFEPLLEKAIAEYPDNTQLPRYLAKAYIAWGKKDIAEETYRKLLLKDNKFYLWKELAMITDDKELKISALCKAILSGQKDDFLGDIHLHLANLLIDDGEFAHALRELNTYADTYKKNSWALKQDYFSTLARIPQGTKAGESNAEFYRSHESAAEEFVYSDIPWTTMAVTDIYEATRDDGKKAKRAKLTSADGDTISINIKRLPGKKEFGVCYNVKILSEGEKKRAVLLKASDESISKLFGTQIAFVDYYNEERKFAHIYDRGSKHYVIKDEPSLKDLKFVKFFAIPQRGAIARGGKIAQAFFAGKVDDQEAMENFPEHTGLVDGVNEGKQLFHCVFGTGVDFVVRYTDTDIRPKVYDTIVARYILKKDKLGKRRPNFIDMKIDNGRKSNFIKKTEGYISVKSNLNGDFGFINDIYVPGRLTEGINDGDYVKATVVFDGKEWRVVEIE